MQGRPYQNKRLIVAALIAAVSLCILILIGATVLHTKKKEAVDKRSSVNFRAYREVDSLSFTRTDGSRLQLSEYKGKTVVLVYWTSWCPYCQKDLKNINTLAQTVTDENDTVFLLVNKLDGKKETQDKAISYLQNQGIAVETVFDKEISVYNELGLTMVPTTLVIDPKSRLMSSSYGKVPEQNELLSMVHNARDGNEASLLSFVKNALLDEQGGMRTNYLDGEGAVPSGDDVLSESMGLILLYAAESGDRTLFDSALRYVQAHSAGDTLAAWVNTSEKSYKANAAIDDLRIYRALYAGNTRWGGYDEAMRTFSNALYLYNTSDSRLMDFYEFDTSAKAKRLTLCYADFEALKQLADMDPRWKKVYDNSIRIVKNGVISEKFPLYRSYYDYTMNRYPATELNMAEALVTLLHLSKAGELPQEAFGWLKERLSEGVIYSRYNETGTATKDGRVESTAVYALCTLIALSEKDVETAQQAIAKMEKLRIHDASSNVNGAFGNVDGSGIFSFDQCMALLAYQQMEDFR